LTRLKGDAEAHGLVARVAKARRVSLRAVVHGGRGPIETALARQIAMYLLHVLLARTQGEIGLIFGRQRSTVSYACQTIEMLRDEDSTLEADIAAIEAEGWRADAAGEVRHAA
jgi:chromosomal replication initiation ATPase DnaA